MYLVAAILLFLAIAGGAYLLYRGAHQDTNSTTGTGGASNHNPNEKLK